MNPRLLAIAGPLKDSTFALPTGEVSIGRDPSNLLSISDLSLSRRHCVLIRESEGYKVRDLNSRNGTLVNGAKTKESQVNHGDQISIGDSTFVLWLREGEEKPSGSAVQFKDDSARATVQIRPQDVLYLQPERLLKEIPAGASVARNLNTLLQVSRVVHSVSDVSELQVQILNLIFEAFPAERGTILLDRRSDGQFDSVFARHRVEPSSQPVSISRTITREVIEQGSAILASDIAASEQFAKLESVVSSQTRSVLCVPLTLFHKVIGCIYIDTTDPADRFNENHLHLLAGIAGPCSVALENLRRLHSLEQENQWLTAEVNLNHNLVGDSGVMKDVYQFIARVAPKDSTVLIQGESGTGKELAARAIHRNSQRSAKPFVTINCAAIPEGLLESELFGHERGAFTGAVMQKKGRLETAEGGVVFLDEIGELAPALQAKLLRVLQEHEFERVGGTRPISVDIRLVAATNRNLEQALESGTFRKDLFYRLNVLSLTMPPLSKRRDDIPMLADYFVQKYSRRCKTKPKPIAPETMACLLNYDWPGNVRELENAIERALVLGASDTISPDDLPEAILEKGLPTEESAACYHTEVKSYKKQMILKALQQANGNYTEAARILGVHVNYLHRLIRNLDLKESVRSQPRLRAEKSAD